MFYDNVYKVCAECGTNPTTLLKDCGFSPGNISKWKHGSVPNVEICLAMARKLGVSLDYLVTLEGPGASSKPISDSDSEWLEIIHRIPKDKQQMCKDFLKTHMAVPEKYHQGKRA